MIKLLNTTSTKLIADQTIPLTLKYNTNNRTSFNNNIITINKPGYYRTVGNFIVQATAADSTVSIQLLSNGIAIPGAIATTTLTEIGDTNTLTIDDIEKIIPTINPTKEQLSFNVSGPCTLLNANVSVVEIK